MDTSTFLYSEGFSKMHKYSGSQGSAGDGFLIDQPASTLSRMFLSICLLFTKFITISPHIKIGWDLQNYFSVKRIKHGIGSDLTEKHT
jgi:hypothetical protein